MSLIQNIFNPNKLSFYETWFGLSLHQKVKLAAKENEDDVRNSK